MAAKEVVPGLYMLALGPVNAFLLVASDGCTVIDTGLPRSAAKLMDTLKAIRQTNIRRVLLTHAHPDHIGGFAALKSITGAEAYMHPADAPIAISGKGFRPMKAAPGLLRGFMFRLFLRPVASVEGAPVEHCLKGWRRTANRWRSESHSCAWTLRWPNGISLASAWGRVDRSRCVQQHTTFGVEPRLRRS
jgi:glyoxylase-like metal-dependent hydrolase (beta-lactamase superfamily II)